MRLYTFYSDTHRQVLEDWFLRTLPVREYEVVADRISQLSVTGRYMEPGWHETMALKVDLILRAIEECWGNPFVYADCDVQWFGRTTEHLLSQLGDLDFAVQDNGNVFNEAMRAHYIRRFGEDIKLGDTDTEVCAGFFICRANEATRKCFSIVKANLHNFEDDQFALNYLIHRLPLRWRRLDHRIWTVSMSIGSGGWNDRPFTVPKNILAHHANWTNGTESKLRLFQLVREQVEQCST